MRLQCCGGGSITDLQLALIGRAEDIDVDLHKLFAHPDGFFLRLQIEDGEAADQFFGLGEWAVNN